MTQNDNEIQEHNLDCGCILLTTTNWNGKGQSHTILCSEHKVEHEERLRHDPKQ